MNTIGEVSERTIQGMFTIEWKIKSSFMLLKKINEPYYSPSFSFNGAFWCLKIYPYILTYSEIRSCNPINNADFVAVYLHKKSFGPAINLQFSLGLKRLDEMIIDFEKNFMHIFDNTDQAFGAYKFVKKSNLLEKQCELMPCNILSIVCKLKHLRSTEVESNVIALPNTITLGTCHYCTLTFEDHEDFLSHLKKCLNKPMKCSDCGDVVHLKDWYDHKCRTATARASANKKKCYYCKQAFGTFKGISSHRDMCPRKPMKCADCGDVVFLKDWYYHSCQGATPKGNTTRETCSYCKLTFETREGILCHKQMCLKKPIKCPDCLDVVFIKDWYEHRCQGVSATEALEKMSHDFRGIMLSGDHSDTIIKVKGKEFRLHRSILSARNIYFDSMFKSDMKEKSTGVVSIDDCEPDIFQSFIHFVYTGRVDKLSPENVCGLYKVADKYQEDQLKKNCLEFMMHTISVDNFCDFIIVALKYDERELLQKAVELFTFKGKEIARSVKWQIFVKEYPTQANELFIKTLDHFIK